MTIEGFDYKSLSEVVSSQVKDTVPSDIEDNVREYISQTMKNFVYLSGEALDNNFSDKYTASQAQMICNYIAEWTYHKSVDLAHSDIPQNEWEPILQNIAYVVFEQARDLVSQGLDDSEIYNILESKVEETFSQILANFSGQNKNPDEEFETTEVDIDESAESEVGQTSPVSEDENVVSETEENKEAEDKVSDDVPEKEQQNEEREAAEVQNIEVTSSEESQDEKYLKDEPELAGIESGNLANNVSESVEKEISKKTEDIPLQEDGRISEQQVEKTSDKELVSRINFLEKINKIQSCINEQIDLLVELKNTAQTLFDSDDLYSAFDSDIITILVGDKLVEFADKNCANGLASKISNLRYMLVGDYGYVIPPVRIINSSAVNPFEYRILLRGDLVSSGYVYSGKYMVLADAWDKYNTEIPQDAIIGVNPVDTSQVYWVVEKDYLMKARKHNIGISAADVIVRDLSRCAIKYADTIIESKDIVKLCEIVRMSNPSIVDDVILKELSITDLRKILVNLILEKVSIKEISFIFEKLADYLKTSNDAEFLAEHIRVELKRKICLSNVKDSDILYAVTLSDEWENILTQTCKNTEVGQVFELPPEQISEFVEQVMTSFIYSRRKLETQPVILCTPKIRHALYSLLVRKIPSVTVISYAELIEEIKVEEVYRIGELNT